VLDRDRHKIRYSDRGWTGRFWAKIAVSAPDDCWPWTGCRDEDGYGLLALKWDDGWRNRRTHRLSYELHRGEIPPGMYVLHSCDNPACCNPAHLRLGTQADNGADMKARGRCKRNGYHRRVHDDATIQAIRAAVAAGAMQKDVAARFGVSRSYVSALVRGKRRAEGVT
jgi:hypothetical protein